MLLLVRPSNKTILKHTSEVNNRATHTHTHTHTHTVYYIIGAEASFKLKIFDDAIAWCSQGLQVSIMVTIINVSFIKRLMHLMIDC